MANWGLQATTRPQVGAWMATLIPLPGGASARGLLWQGLLLAVVVFVGWSLYDNMVRNMAARGLQFGFGFLDRSAGIAREAWGRGYAPEAAAASIGWAFDQLGWGEVIHTIDPDNANSKTVAAKLGSTYQRMDRLPEPHHEKPVEVWGQTRAQWQLRGATHP